ncbi:unnamed protein product [Haemonchus placei]|uniref:Phage protein n=1 Tax=Haemonchus placei TaxID=6290 RepID=A0A0N4X9E6_HAEPC|nr:unnamed protein product [Haemonchus placei]
MYIKDNDAVERGKLNRSDLGYLRTERPPFEEQNAFQRAGWETDDDGNVFVGNDNCKLLLISVGDYWPYPKDYRKK